MSQTKASITTIVCPDKDLHKNGHLHMAVCFRLQKIKVMSDVGRRLLSDLHALVTALLEETLKVKLKDVDHAKDARQEGKTERVTVSSM